jgi:hypothetical protein
MRVSYKGGEVQDENSRAATGNHQDVIPAETKLVIAVAAKEAWATSSNLLDYPEENRLK